MKKCVHIGGILADLLQQHRRELGREMARIRELWAHVVGDFIANNAQPVAFQKRLLSVNVTSSVWIQQLQFLKGDILSRLRDVSGDMIVEDIKFRIGPLAP